MRHTAAARLLAFAMLAAACTGGSSVVPSATGSSATVSSGPVVAGSGSAAAARKALCDVPDQTPPPEGKPKGGTPPEISEVEREVEQVRGLDYTSPVPVEPVTTARMANEIHKSFDQTYPADLYGRRSRAWATIGAVSEGTSLRNELEKFQTGQVVGFYVPENGRLVFIGQDRLSPLSHVVLAHELTHALDDQHFNLDRIDGLVTSCADEELQASLGAIEGSAQFFSIQVARDYLTADELLQVGQEAGAAPAPHVQPFVERMQLWPYEAGLRFVSAIDAAGGTSAVNRALQHLPVSTEQVMHPDLYPGDVPSPVDVPDLGPKLGRGWKDLDVSDVGESFLDTMLSLRLDRTRADEAAAGWDGGIYRAWSHGSEAAVVMRTTWDTANDARQFATTMADWIDAGDQVAEVLPVGGTRVEVLFASDVATLAALRAAAA